MTEESEFTKRLPRYLKRLATEYERNDMSTLAPVLADSKYELNFAVSYDKWDGGQYGHDIIFHVPDSLMGLIPLDQQSEIQSRISQDLNKASSSINNEYINEVHFEYADEKVTQDTIVDSKVMARLWEPNTLKLFISHRDTHKRHAHDLADSLKHFGISSFVAHDSIEPDEEWQKEIEKALQSMDVMLCLITENFFDSAWTNQEIGYAIAKGIPIVSLKVQEQDPIGFIKDRQAVRGSLDDLAPCIQPIFETIKKRLSRSALWRQLVISRFCGAISYAEAKKAAVELFDISDLSASEVERIVEAFNRNSQLNGCWYINTSNKFTDFLNKYTSETLVLQNCRLMVEQKNPTWQSDEEIPF